MTMEGKDMKRDGEKKVVEALAKELGCERETAQLVSERMRARPIIQVLTATRVKHNLTQKEIASLMGCSESKVCRMEGATDADLNFGDMNAYARATGLNMSLFFDDSSLPNATRIRHCVCEIATMLKHLTNLAKEEDEDDTLRNAINRFQGEVLMDFLVKYKESGAAIPSFAVPSPVSPRNAFSAPSHVRPREAVGV